MLIHIFSVNSSALSQEEKLAFGVYSVTAVTLGERKKRLEN